MAGMFGSRGRRSGAAGTGSAGGGGGTALGGAVGGPGNAATIAGAGAIGSLAAAGLTNAAIGGRASPTITFSAGSFRTVLGGGAMGPNETLLSEVLSSDGAAIIAAVCGAGRCCGGGNGAGTAYAGAGLANAGGPGEATANPAGCGAAG